MDIYDEVAHKTGGFVVNIGGIPPKVIGYRADRAEQLFDEKVTLLTYALRIIGWQITRTDVEKALIDREEGEENELHLPIELVLDGKITDKKALGPNFGKI